MKEFFSVLMLLISFFGSAQNSYEFAIALPPDAVSINTVAPSFFGTYQQESDFPNYEINGAGIFLNSLQIQSVSRDTIRESSQFQIKNNFIYGVEGYDSLPCVLDGERYYFGVPRREMIAGKGCKNQLRMLSKNEYLLNFEEGGNFIPCKLRFDNKMLKISYFDYTTGENKGLEAIKKQQSVVTMEETAVQQILLLPTQKEWAKLLQAGLFGEAISYKIR